MHRYSNHHWFRWWLVSAKPLSESMLEYNSLIGPSGARFGEIPNIFIQEMYLKVSSVKWPTFYLGLNVLTRFIYYCTKHINVMIRMPSELRIPQQKYYCTHVASPMGITLTFSYCCILHVLCFSTLH